MDNGHIEIHTDATTGRANWLRAAVLGADVGVAGASVSAHVILLTGIAGLLAGAFSMAAGEYVSVSSQRDSERSLLEKERFELANYPESEFDELVSLYEKKGLTQDTARIVAKELTAHDAFAAHVDAELGIDPNNLTSPVQAAIASALAFTAGAIIPVISIVVAPEGIRIGVTFGAVIIALILTGIVSARVSGARTLPVMARVVIGGTLAMAITFGIGRLLNAPV
jgi:VIT1/CCC1 family predicted Fe2+/Mn2+ transporter